MIKKIFSVFPEIIGTALRLRGELMLNRNEGTVAFILHRLTGLCLVGYIFLHLVVVGSNFIFGGDSFNTLMGTFEHPLVKALEIGLISVIAYHIINGLRIIVVDFLTITRTQRTMFWIVMAFCISAVAITAVVFLPKIM